MLYRLFALAALFACTEAFVAPASAVVTRTAVRSAEPAMFGGGKKSAPKAVAAPKGKAAPKAVKKAAKKVAPKPAAKKAAPAARRSSPGRGGLFSNGVGAMSSKSGKEDSFQNRIFGASKKSLYP